VCFDDNTGVIIKSQMGYCGCGVLVGWMWAHALCVIISFVFICKAFSSSIWFCETVTIHLQTTLFLANFVITQTIYLLRKGFKCLHMRNKYDTQSQYFVCHVNVLTRPISP